MSTAGAVDLSIHMIGRGRGVQAALSRVRRATVLAGLAGALGACAGHGPEIPLASALLRPVEPVPGDVPPQPTIERPEQLMHLTATEVTKLLGQPSLMHSDPPAVIWQYAGGECVLLVFLYADAPGTPLRVAHVESRGRHPSTSGQDCFAHVVHDGPPPAAS